MKRLSLFLFCFSTCLYGQVLDHTVEIDMFKGKHIGFYLGSFDPIHNGHQKFIKEVLDNELVDFVLLYAAPGSDWGKNRTDMDHRFRMLKGLYESHESVFITEFTPWELQQYFMPHIEALHFTGMIGSDTMFNLVNPSEKFSKYSKLFMRGVPLPERHRNDPAGAILALSVDSFIIGLRYGAEPSEQPVQLEERSVIGYVETGYISSSLIRSYLIEGVSVNKLVHESVMDYIHENGLYHTQICEKL